MIELKSGFNDLLILNINELLNVQCDVNNLLRQKFQELENTPILQLSKKNEYNKHTFNTTVKNEVTLNRRPFIKPENVERTRSPSKGKALRTKKSKKLPTKKEVEYIESSDVNLSDDTEEFIMTQYDTIARSKLFTAEKEHQDSVTVKEENINENLRLIPSIIHEDSLVYTSKGKIYSSPLKDSSGFISTQEIVQTPIFKNKIGQNKDNVPNLNSKTKRILQFPEKDYRDETLDHKRSHISTTEKYIQKNTVLQVKTNIVSKKVLSEKKNFNLNPITLKPWILEDFKPNNDTNNVKQGKKKLEQFYAKVGKPTDLTNAEFSSSQEKDTTGLDEYKFDNLRTRIDSPPGYGRLDFPTTQERVDDKLKSHKIIYEKTKYRFSMAISCRIPPQEREFLFKRAELNEIVDNNDFVWDIESLKIYPVG